LQQHKTFETGDSTMIETRQLTKRYGDLTAVDDISFKVEPGQVLGFLGPNGAGKSTTMKMIAGFLAPTSGSASVCGHDVSEQPLQAKSVIGYLTEGAPSYRRITPSSSRSSPICGSLRKHRTQRIDDVIERLYLNGVLGQPIETL
jgi:ABC-2 type transport system ATP-binding protein